jgi:hypothetical protein
MKTLIAFLLSATLGTIAINLSAQPYVEGGNTRHRFAQMYIGAEGLFQPGLDGQTRRIGENGELQGIFMKDRIAPRLTIGATHFWGHADFYVTFNVLPQRSITSDLQYGYQLGVETGARVYPWRVERDGLRPFVGVAWSSGTYSQGKANGSASEQGSTIRLDRAILQSGLTYQTGDVILEGGAKWIPQNTLEYWVNREMPAPVSFPNVAFWVGAKYVFDTTLPEEDREKSGYLKKREEVYRRKNKLNSWTIAAGPSTATALGVSPYNVEKLPFMNQTFSANSVALDFAIGYYLFDVDAHLNLSYRPLIGSQRGYGVQQEVNRHAVALEAYKFLGDYHGFVPFVGATLGYESLQYIETDNGIQKVNQTEGKLLPGVIFGWDIRPTTTDAWLLRTNLRYTPGAALKVQGKDIIFPNFEFNFIQLVLNLNRIFQ